MFPSYDAETLKLLLSANSMNVERTVETIFQMESGGEVTAHQPDNSEMIPDYSTLESSKRKVEDDGSRSRCVFAKQDKEEALLMGGNNEESREHFEKLGFLYFPGLFDAATREKIDEIFGIVFTSKGKTRSEGARPFVGKGYTEGTLQSAHFHKAAAALGAAAAAAAVSSSSSSGVGETSSSTMAPAWVRVGSDKDKNSVPETTLCWHEGHLEMPIADLQPRPELVPVYEQLMRLMRSPAGATTLDAHVPDKDALYLIQVIKYLRSAADLTKRGSHQDDIQNAAHVIAGYTGGHHARFLILKEAGGAATAHKYTFKLEPGSLYIMKDHSRYGDKFGVKVEHEPTSLINQECLALVFRLGTPPQRALAAK